MAAGVTKAMSCPNVTGHAGTNSADHDERHRASLGFPRFKGAGGCGRAASSVFVAER